MSNKHSALVQQALERLGYKNYAEYTAALKADYEEMAKNPEFQDEMAFLRSGIPSGYTVVPPDTLQRMAAVTYWSVQFKKSVDCMQRGHAFGRYESAFKALTPEDLQHIARLAKGDNND